MGLKSAEFGKVFTTFVLVCGYTNGLMLPNFEVLGVLGYTSWDDYCHVSSFFVYVPESWIFFLGS